MRSWREAILLAPDDGTGAAPTPSAPSAAPGSPPAAPENEPTPEPSDDFSGLGLDEIEVVEPVSPPKPKAERAKEPPAAEPAEEPPKVEAKPPAPAKEEPKPKGEPEAKPAEPSAPAAPALSLVEQVEQHRDALIGELASKRFGLSQEEAELFDSDAPTAIARFGARVFYEASVNTLNHIENRVPALIEEYLSRKTAHDEALNSFFDQFKALDRTKHRADVYSFGRAFRAADPKVTRENLYAMIGAAVMAKHGISPTAGAPATPSPGNGVAPPKPATQPPFVPAPPGASVRTTPILENENPFAGLGQSFDDE